MSEQLTLFHVDEPQRQVINGDMRLVWTADGRTLLWVDSGKGGAWLELSPADQAWLAAHVVNAQPALLAT